MGTEKQRTLVSPSELSNQVLHLMSKGLPNQTWCNIHQLLTSTPAENYIPDLGCLVDNHVQAPQMAVVPLSQVNQWVAPISMRTSLEPTNESPSPAPKPVAKKNTKATQVSWDLPAQFKYRTGKCQSKVFAKNAFEYIKSQSENIGKVKKTGNKNVGKYFPKDMTNWEGIEVLKSGIVRFTRVIAFVHQKESEIAGMKSLSVAVYDNLKKNFPKTPMHYMSEGHFPCIIFGEPK